MSAKKKKNRAARRAAGPVRPSRVATPPVDRQEAETPEASESAEPEVESDVETEVETEVEAEVVEVETDDEHEVVEHDHELQSDADRELAVPDPVEQEPEVVEPEPEREVVEPEPEREVVEPEPEREVVEPEPEREVVEPEPEPAREPTRHAVATEGAPEAARGTNDDTEPQPATPGPAATSQRAWRRLGRAASPRPTKANVLATLLALGLGFAIAAQVRQTSIEGLEDLREDELIRILDTVDQDGNRLAEEIQTLRFSRDRLQSDTTSLTESRRAAQQRLDSLAILTGTAAARGPGIVLTIRDPEFGVTAPMLLDTLQELRDAGAEAVEINDVRIVANSFFTDSEGGISISGKAVSAPYVITAIGDGSTLASAMEIPGGVTNTVRSVGGEAGVETKDEVTVSALQSVSEPQYARPIPSPTTS
ncbi:DUF881 domain-containing protein [Knoellia locipacati]|uniref:DUF881 domain-containing protein n=1 Tax=Knoellia locipacati TaxID=882824 RepID=UPI00384E87FD